METTKSISLRGVRVHNLKGIDVEIPLAKLTVVTGISGSGKSSLVFDTLYAEAQRRYLQSFSTYTRQFLERFDKPDAEEIGDLTPAIAIRGAKSNSPRATVGSLTEISDDLRLLFASAGVIICAGCGQRVTAHRPIDAFAALQAKPAGTRCTIAFPVSSSAELYPPSPPLPKGGKGSSPPLPKGGKGSSPPLHKGGKGGVEIRQADWLAGLLEEGYVRIQVGDTVYRLGEQAVPPPSPADKIWVLLDRVEVGKTPAERLWESIETAFRRGQGRLGVLTDAGQHVFDQRHYCERCDRFYPAPEPRRLDANDPLGACPACQGAGTIAKTNEICPECQGRRFNADALAVQVGGRSIAEWGEQLFSDLLLFSETLAFPDDQSVQAGVLLDQIRAGLQSLVDLELGYLTLNQFATTLSEGETKRIGLSAALASNLVHVLYLIDEPTAGVHPCHTGKIVSGLIRLRERGNTVVVIEHDRQVIEATDHVIDLGPGAGEEGGQVCYQGSLAGLASAAANPTSDYWSRRSFIEVPPQRRKPAGFLKLRGASANNLQNLTVDFPLGVLCAVTGVSGAGKRSLVAQTLYPALCRVKKRSGVDSIHGEGGPASLTGAQLITEAVLLDQDPLPRSARSNPATYLKIFDEIRSLFAETAEARIRNFGPGAFSFNQPGGRCETCEGQGTLTIDMRFLADVTSTCPECLGRRYRKEILDIKVRSLSIAEVLDLTIRAAFRFFRAQPKIEKKLRWLLDVGLDYLRLGQAMETLSGGECQRLQLASYLAASRKPGCLFILVEPSAGLHPAEVKSLLDCFDRLLAAGHSLIVLEYDLDVIGHADYVIDLGPEGGKQGGRLVAHGTPEDVAHVAASHTGQCLRTLLPLASRER